MFNFSYINFFYPNGSLREIIIHEIGNGMPKMLFDSRTTTNNLMVVLITSRHPVQIYKGLKRVLKKCNSGIVAVHILILPSAKKWHISYTMALHFLVCKLASSFFGNCVQSYGFMGDLMNPKQIFPFTKAFLRYYSAFYTSGSFVITKSAIEKIFASLFGFWPWPGPLLIACSATSCDVQKKPSGNQLSCSEMIHKLCMGNDKYVNIVYNKEIWFLFDPNFLKPYAVAKRGREKDLCAEYLRHKKAYDLMPNYVPKIGKCYSFNEKAAFCMEYVDEHTIGSHVSKCRFKRKQRFYQGAGHLFNFLVNFMKDIINLTPRVFVPAQEFHLGYIEHNLASLDSVSSKSLDLIMDCLHKIKGFDLPLIPQHGDFSVGNIHCVDDVRLKLIDWEAFEVRSLPLIDFAMLTFSLESLGNSILGISKGSLHQQKEFRVVVNTAEQRLQSLLNLNGHQFKLTSILSTAYLCARNFDRISPNPSRRLYEYLERQVSELSSAES